MGILEQAFSELALRTFRDERFTITGIRVTPAILAACSRRSPAIN